MRLHPDQLWIQDDLLAHAVGETVSSTTVTVTSLVVAPDTSTVAITGTQAFTATAHLSDGSTVDVTTLSTWDTSDHSKATIGVSSGVLTGVAAGTCTVSATFGSVSDSSSTITVVAVPTIRAVGTFDGSANTPVPTIPSHAANTIIVLFLESCAQTISLTTANGFTEITGTRQTTGTGGTDPATQAVAYWKRAASGAETAAAIADSGDHTGGIYVCIDGCVTSGDPFQAVAGDVEATGATAVAVPGGTTTKVGALVLAVTSRDNDAAVAAFSAWANASLTSVAEIFDAGAAAGNGGGLGAAAGAKIAAGAVGTTTATSAVSTKQARFSIAFTPY
jgi:hypothetical protein